MVVREITPRRKGLSAVYFDSEDHFYSLDTKVLKEQGIHCGTELTEKELLSLISLSNDRRAQEKALQLLTFRDYSRAELEEKLKQAGYFENAEKTAEKMMDIGLINDESYARRKLEYLMNTKHFSLNRAKYELIQKGVDRETVESLAEELSIDPAEQIRRYVEKKPVNLLQDGKSMRRLVSALMRRGFNYSDIKTILEEKTGETYCFQDEEMI